MSEHTCLFTEQEVIDAILGKLPADRSAQCLEHAAACPTCRGHYEEWKSILHGAPQAAPQGTGQGTPQGTAQSASQHAHNEDTSTHAVPDRLHTKLRLKFILYRKIPAFFRKQQLKWLPVAGAVALLLVIFGWNQSQPSVEQASLSPLAGHQLAKERVTKCKAPANKTVAIQLASGKWVSYELPDMLILVQQYEQSPLFKLHTIQLEGQNNRFAGNCIQFPPSSGASPLLNEKEWSETIRFAPQLGNRLVND